MFRPRRPRSDLKRYGLRFSRNEKIEGGLRANYPTGPTGTISRWATAGPRVHSPRSPFGESVCTGSELNADIHPARLRPRRATDAAEGGGCYTPPSSQSVTGLRTDRSPDFDQTGGNESASGTLLRSGIWHLRPLPSALLPLAIRQNATKANGQWIAMMSQTIYANAVLVLGITQRLCHLFSGT